MGELGGPRFTFVHKRRFQGTKTEHSEPRMLYDYLTLRPALDRLICYMLFRARCLSLCPCRGKHHLYARDFKDSKKCRADRLNINRFQDAFKNLGKPPHVYLAINAEDSNIVYYKISPGLVKPPV
jgi:hypothetical protein